MVYNDAQLGLEILASFSNQHHRVLQCPRAVMDLDSGQKKPAATKATQNRYLMPYFLSLEASKNL